MKQIYWDAVEISNHKFFFTMTQDGVNFVSSPESYLSEIFDFYPDDHFNYQFKHDETVTADVKRQFEHYLTGKRETFDVKLDLTVGTAFQHEIWQVVSEIPYGTTMTYAEVAKKVNRPRAARAVGHALALNPVLILIPCHRVILSNGDLGRYRGGTDSKKELLRIEKSVVAKKATTKKLVLPRISQLGKSDL